VTGLSVSHFTCFTAEGYDVTVEPDLQALMENMALNSVQNF